MWSVLPGLIAELIALPLDAIAIVGAATAKQVSAATKTIPLVFSIVVDPVADGLVADARRPGGNLTGVTNFDPQQASAHMRLLKEICPGLSSVAILVIPACRTCLIAPMRRQRKQRPCGPS